ncbi:MAG: M20/M25/M40 family metallo-hydrolase [Ardenticatenaceae bacterium]|nr:M20/M25/M40 family metallo-hydrolase [Ardenticatenaceae bacterium]
MPKSISSLRHDPAVDEALISFRRDLNHGVELAIAIQQIPAPTFSEGDRAKRVLQYFVDLGLSETQLDSLFNVYGRLAGQRSDLPPVIISAHTDTVFPAGTDLTVKKDGNRVFGPGIADNSMGVAGLIWLIESLQTHNLSNDRDLWFVANVGEEGLGDLVGMRAVVERFGPEASYIVLEGGSYGHLIHKGIGVKRFEVVVKARGGHSWADFGQSSAIHNLGRIIGEIDHIAVPSVPKTSFNVGVIEGGTSINTIAESAKFLLDLRSESAVELTRLVDHVHQIFNKYDQLATVQVAARQIGDRPAGETPQNSLLVRWAAEALSAVGCRKVEYGASSTDANIPLSLGADAICIGIGESGNVHRLNEFLDIANIPRGMGQLLLLTLMTANFLEM